MRKHAHVCMHWKETKREGGGPIHLGHISSLLMLSSRPRARSTLMLSFRDGKRQIKFLFSRKICRIFQPKRISDIVNDGAWKYYFLIRFFLRRDFRAKIQLLGMGLNRLPAKIDKEAIKFTPSSTNYTASTCSGVWLDAFLFTIHLCTY